MPHTSPKQLHVPVMLEQVLKYLAPETGESYLDLTAGYGGHASAVLQRTKGYAASVLVDRDQRAIDELAVRFKGQPVTLLRQDFLSAAKLLAGQGRKFDLLLADLGLSSPHLNQADRGFAINANGSLDMRMDQSQALTAAAVVNTYSEAELTDILQRYGEEPKARAIARLIIANRPVRTTTELAAIVTQAWPGHSRLHPATRTFQAIRIAVNDELELLRQALPIWDSLLKPGGRMVVISFQSLEDRLVKNYLQDQGGDRYDAGLRLLSKRPVVPEPNELVFNPRARSAKLRAAAKINI